METEEEQLEEAKSDQQLEHGSFELVIDEVQEAEDHIEDDAGIGQAEEEEEAIGTCQNPKFLFSASFSLFSASFSLPESSSDVKKICQFNNHTFKIDF